MFRAIILVISRSTRLCVTACGIMHPRILFFLQIKVTPFKIVPLGSYTATEALFLLFVAVLECFCCYTFQLVGYALLDIIQSTKMVPFQVVFEPGE